MPTIDATRGRLTLQTTVTGIARRLGHDLTLAIEEFSADYSMHDGRPATVSLTASLASLVVVNGRGGLKPLSTGDRRTIRANALKTLSAEAFPVVSYNSSSVAAAGGGYLIAGDLSIAGTTRPQHVNVTVEHQEDHAGTTVSAVTVVSQRAFGITPYSAMLGGLVVGTDVTVRLEAVLADAG